MTKYYTLIVLGLCGIVRLFTDKMTWTITGLALVVPVGLALFLSIMHGSRQEWRRMKRGVDIDNARQISTNPIIKYYGR